MDNAEGFTKDEYILDIKNSNVSNDFICPICQSLFIEATEIKICGHTYCKDCIFKWSVENQNCPMCKVGYFSFDLTPSKFIDRHISNFNIECPKCDWKGIYGDYLKHIDENNVVDRCDNLMVPCILCNEKIKSNKMQTHKHTDCPYRNVSCNHCNQTIQLAETQKHIDNNCSETVIQCENEPCSFIAKRKEHKEHLKSCEHEVINCKYKSIGCNDHFQRKDENVHMMLKKDKHLENSLNLIQDLIQENKQLTERYKNMATSSESWKLLCTQQTRIINHLGSLSNFNFRPLPETNINDPDDENLLDRRQQYL